MAVRARSIINSFALVVPFQLAVLADKFHFLLPFITPFISHVPSLNIFSNILFVVISSHLGISMYVVTYKHFHAVGYE